MKMLLLLSLCVTSLAGAETFQVEFPKGSLAPVNYPPNAPESYAVAPIDIPAGITLEVLGVYGSEAAISAYITVGTTEVGMALSSAQQKPANYGTPSTIIGPATVRFARNGNNAQIVTYRFTDGELSTKSDAVVIPDDNSGNHQVILEASNDMVVRQEVQPGTYPTTTSRRFFRVRIQKE